MSNKSCALAAALTGCAVVASTIFMRQRLRREALRQHGEDVRTWEGEGGKPAPVATRPAPLP